MDKRAILAIAIALCFGAFPENGLGQGAAEYSLTTSNAAAAAAKAGSALNKATQQLAGRAQEQLSKSADKPQQTNHQPSHVAGDHSVATKAQAVESAVPSTCGDGEAKTADTKQKAGAQYAACVTLAGTGTPGSKPNLSAKAETQVKYPSVVNLSSSK